MCCTFTPPAVEYGPTWILMRVQRVKNDSGDKNHRGTRGGGCKRLAHHFVALHLTPRMTGQPPWIDFCSSSPVVLMLKNRRADSVERIGRALVGGRKERKRDGRKGKRSDSQRNGRKREGNQQEEPTQRHVTLIYSCIQVEIPSIISAREVLVSWMAGEQSRVANRRPSSA